MDRKTRMTLTLSAVGMAIIMIAIGCFTFNSYHGKLDRIETILAPYDAEVISYNGKLLEVEIRDRALIYPTDYGCKRAASLYHKLTSVIGKKACLFVHAEWVASSRNPMDYAWTSYLTSFEF